jgi:hypothetical protein
MLTAGYTGWWGEEGSNVTTLSTAAACSVATRGLLFANTQPVGQRWVASIMALLLWLLLLLLLGLLIPYKSRTTQGC